MAYTATITDDFMVEVFKDGELYDRVGPWADEENAQNYIDTKLHKYAEMDEARANGSLLLDEFKKKLEHKLRALPVMLTDAEKEHLLAD